jgi:hypothetical protein
MTRAGRKRSQNVVRFPCGRAKEDNSLKMPHNTENVRITGDGKLGTKHGLERVTDVLEILSLTKSQRLAGQEFAKLRDLCRLYAWDAPKMSAKVSNPMGGHAHPGEPTAEIISLGEKYHAKYIQALGAIRRRKGHRHTLSAIVAVCLENKMPTSEQRVPLVAGLDILVELWSL